MLTWVSGAEAWAPDSPLLLPAGFPCPGRRALENHRFPGLQLHSPRCPQGLCGSGGQKTSLVTPPARGRAQTGCQQLGYSRAPPRPPHGLSPAHSPARPLTARDFRPLPSRLSSTHGRPPAASAFRELAAFLAPPTAQLFSTPHRWRLNPLAPPPGKQRTLFPSSAQSCCWPSTLLGSPGGHLEPLPRLGALPIPSPNLPKAMRLATRSLHRDMDGIIPPIRTETLG